MTKPKLIHYAALLLIVATPLTGHAAWQLIWSDEFTQPDGSSPDPAKWGYDLGGWGWGNNELQSYTSRTNNARIVGGQLVIEARQESYTGADNIPRDYTSARLLTKDKWAWTYGRIEARIKVPRTQGIWPAFWMLGQDIGSVGWPQCGEIDIMEHIGREPKKVFGTVHGPGYSGGGSVGGSYTFGPDVAEDFHEFAVEWETNVIRWYVDGIQYFTVTPANLGGNPWVFNHPHFLLLNVAVGGYWPGYPDATTVLPQQMLVDYVRVYRQVTAPPDPVTLAIQTGGRVSWPTTSGTTWTLQSGNEAEGWTSRLGPGAGDGGTNSCFDPLWLAQMNEYRVLETTLGAGNLVANFGFETGSGSTVSNWSATGSQPPVRINTNAHAGQFSLLLAVTNTAATPNNSQIEQNVVNQGGGPVIAGQTYSLSFRAWQASSGVSLVQNCRVIWLNGSGGNVGDTGWIGFTGGAGFWKQISVTNLVAPPNAINALITLYATTGAVANGHGRVLIDEVALAYSTTAQTNVIPAAVQPAVQITWPGTSGSFYDVEWTAAPGTGSWSNLVSGVAGNGGTNAVTDLSITNQSRLYRVVQ